MPTNQICYAFSDYEYKIEIKNKNFTYKSSDFAFKLGKIQKENYHNLDTLKKLISLNFSSEEAITYVFPEVNEIYKILSRKFYKPETSDEVLIVENKCKLKINSGSKGLILNKKYFFDEVLKKLKSGEVKLKINPQLEEYKYFEDARKIFVEKGCFSTYFGSSSEERKNNIQVALKTLDGIIIEEGEEFSFNKTTGERSENYGYKNAKIISNGTFVMGLGGGVCQVSTTLYNACLLSGLEIIEAKSHSLPVSYVEPSFDAMVSFGSSDLRFRNNSGGKIIITTSSENDICKIKIFGLKNKYKITRQSEKIEIISAEQDTVETDYKKYGDYDLEIGEEKRLSFPKDGFISRGYLSYYDENGELVDRKMFRENRYNPTKGVVLKREN